jgi:hypothetical protein
LLLSVDHTSESDIGIWRSESTRSAPDLHVPDSQAFNQEVSLVSPGQSAGEREIEHKGGSEHGGDGSGDSLPEKQKPPPVLVERNGMTAPEWPVEGIINSRLALSKSKGRWLEYLVDWEGDEPTWQPRHDLIPGCEELVHAFHKRHPNRPSPADLDNGKTLKRRGGPSSGKRCKRARLGI